jgi:hypothetical protein
MARKFVISEEQYNMALKEGVTLNADVAAAGGDVKRAVDTTKKEALKNGIKMDDATISIKAAETNEGILVKKSKLQESRLKALKRNSEIYTVRDFMKKLDSK